MSKIYRGCRMTHKVDVSVNGQPLDPRPDLWNRRPTGFDWGHGGDAPAQLALAILADYFGDDLKAIALHYDFKWTVVAKLTDSAWILTSEEIASALQTPDCVDAKPRT